MRGTILLIPLFQASRGLDNGAAKTPPMGWMAWERFRCSADCAHFPDRCVSEELVKQHADILAGAEWQAAGYNRIHLDDCWSEKTRSSSGKLVPDTARFPRGLGHLGKYLHGKGLRFGIYNDIGTKTCCGYPGECSSEDCAGPGFMAMDAATYAHEWHIDFLKMDGCNSEHTAQVLDSAYIQMGRQLNATGRPILYSCSWPVYLPGGDSASVNYSKIAEACNMWRVTGDIQDDWQSVMSIVDWMGDHQDVLIPAHGPHHWNDPDALIVGNFGLSVEQARSQFALWCILAAPLLMGNDLRNLSPDMKAILLNRELIAVDQDSLGVQGKRVVHNTTFAYTHDIWVKQLDSGDVAVVLWNRCPFGTPLELTLLWQDAGLNPGELMQVRDLYAHIDVGVFKDSYTQSVNPWGVAALRLSIYGGAGEIVMM